VREDETAFIAASGRFESFIEPYELLITEAPVKWNVLAVLRRKPFEPASIFDR
jgi:hypothetical protein